MAKNDDENVETLSKLVRQCQNNYIIELALTNNYAVIDNENNISTDVNLLSNNGRLSNFGRLSTLSRECEKIGKLLLALSHPQKRNILYLGIKAGFFYLNGIKKLLGYHYLTTQRILQDLTNHEIIRLLSDEEKQQLAGHIRKWNMREIDFERADFYIIEPSIRNFLENLPWDEFLDEKWAKDQIDRWVKELRKPHRIEERKVEILRESETEQKVRIFISKIQEKFIQLAGDKYEKHREKWFEIRQKLKQLYAAKINGKNWKYLAKNLNGSDFFISCIENEAIDWELLEPLLDGKYKEGENESN